MTTRRLIPGSAAAQQANLARRYEVVDYSAQWPGKFQVYHTQIASRFPRFFVAIHHIGSTAVVGLSAKPIIDMLATVQDMETVDRLDDDFRELGFSALGEFGLPGRRYFVLDRGSKRLVNLHVFAQDHPAVARHLAFRDFLRDRSDVRDQYDRLKKSLYLAVPDDFDAYMDGKDQWIKATEQCALSLHGRHPGPAGVQAPITLLP